MCYSKKDLKKKYCFSFFSKKNHNKTTKHNIKIKIKTTQK